MKITTMTQKIAYYADRLQFAQDLDEAERQRCQAELERWSAMREQARAKRPPRGARTAHTVQADAARKRIESKRRTIEYYATMRPTNPDYFDSVRAVAEIELERLQVRLCKLTDPGHTSGQCKRGCFK